MALTRKTGLVVRRGRSCFASVRKVLVGLCGTRRPVARVASLFLGGLLNFGRLELGRALTRLHALLTVAASQLSGRPYVAGAVAAGVTRVLLLVELDSLSLGQTIEAAIRDRRA